jgi:hypothetical protein
MISGKKCTKCGVVKSLSEFTKRSVTKDGYHCNCKSCTRKVVKAYADKKVSEHTDFKLAEIEKANPVKVCNKCGNVKPLMKFHILRQRADGHDETCIECRKQIYKNHVICMTDKMIADIAIDKPLKICS